MHKLMFDLREIITLTSKRSKHQIPKAKILDEEHVHLPSAQHSTVTNINFCTRLTAKGAAIAAFLICRSHLHIHCRFSRLMQCKATRMSPSLSVDRTAPNFDKILKQNDGQP